MDVIDELLKFKDLEYKTFQSKLIPNIDSNTMIGVRTPKLKDIARNLYKNNDYELFLNSLPHNYYEENIIHGLVISEIKNYDLCINYMDKFFPYVDNWAVCDQTNPKIFKKHKKEVLLKINEWIKSKEVYKIRFGVKTLMNYFLDDDFNKDYLKLPFIIKNDDYYVKMMIAWFYSTALAKKYDETIKIIESNELDIFIHNKTIQKAIESFRVTDEHKKYLRTLKR